MRRRRPRAPPPHRELSTPHEDGLPAFDLSLPTRQVFDEVQSRLQRRRELQAARAALVARRRDEKRAADLGGKGWGNSATQRMYAAGLGQAAELESRGGSAQASHRTSGSSGEWVGDASARVSHDARRRAAPHAERPPLDAWALDAALQRWDRQRAEARA